MAIFNYLCLNILCPRCGVETEMEAEFRFGLRELIRYHIGDTLRWDGSGIKTPDTRPENGDFDGEAYMVCPLCQRDFWLTIFVRNDILESARVDPTKTPYISDDAIQPQATEPTPSRQWDPLAHAEMMKKKTSPPVSAFFLIDSPEAIQKCIQWLAVLQPYNLPDLTDSPYFREVADIYKTGRRVMNFDYDFSIRWQGVDYPEKLRCHSLDAGRCELELWLPGVVAAEIADHFTDGHTGFFCAFMSHAFYD